MQQIFVQSLLLSCLMIVWNVSTVSGICQKKEVFNNLVIPGHHPLPVRYNVCVDNTTISPAPTLVRTRMATFVRECCGCRVSSVTERELRIHTVSPPSETHSIYIPEIRSCECIPCDVNVYSWADYLLFLNHRRRK